MDLHDIADLDEVTVKDMIVLRPLEIAESARILEILDSDREIRKRVKVARDFTDEKAIQKEVDSYKNDPDSIRYSIFDGDRYIGLLSFWRLGSDLEGIAGNDVYGFGYFMDPRARGRGIVSAAIKSVMLIARDNLDVEKFIAFCEDDNPASIRVLEKSGFVATDEIIYFPRHDWHERVYEATGSRRAPS